MTQPLPRPVASAIEELDMLLKKRTGIVEPDLACVAWTLDGRLIYVTTTMRVINLSKREFAPLIKTITDFFWKVS